MQDVLTVQGLCKQYEGFALRDVSFTLRPGAITGLIGRNGAGKSTTLKSLLNLVHPDSGDISFFGQPFLGHEQQAKQQLSFVMGGFNYYPMKKLKTITAATRPFYTGWDEDVYRRCIQRFKLPEQKTPRQLSDGMRVKYALALALSHHAKLLILDEPTSGLDPVSRDELMELFLALVQEEGVTILFSTHITTDLEKCADDILYIKNGELVAQTGMTQFLEEYRMVSFATPQPPQQDAEKLIGCRPSRTGCEALVHTANLPIGGAEVQKAGLEDIMVHMERA